MDGLTDDEPRPYTAETGTPRVDAEGVGWFACDPYPTWYRWEGRRLITRAEPSHVPWKADDA